MFHWSLELFLSKAPLCLSGKWERKGGGHFSINTELGLFCAQQAEVAYLSALLSKSFWGMVNNRLHC